jgi:hypothetical protein
MNFIPNSYPSIPMVDFSSYLGIGNLMCTRDRSPGDPEASPSMIAWQSAFGQVLALGKIP